MALYEQFLPESLKDPEARTGEVLVDYLIGHPDATGNFRFDKLDSGQLRRLLSACPQFADRCHIGRIKAEDVCAVIIAQPGLLDRFKPTRSDWVQILCHRPELVEKLPCYLNKSDWHTILRHQPGLWFHSPFHDFDSLEWSELIRDQPTLAKQCPWERLNFIRPWRDSLLLYPEVVLAYREDWEPFHHTGGYGPENLAPLIARKPELGEKVDFGMFGRKEWEIILESQPQLIAHCDVGDIFEDVPFALLTAHPELAEHFDWATRSRLRGFFQLPAWPELFSKFTRERPELANRIMQFFGPESWEYLLPKYPEYLLEHNGDMFPFLHNLQAFLLSGFLDFDGTGLDSICNNFYDLTGKNGPAPTGWFEEEDFTPAEFLIRSVMDHKNARRFFLRKIHRRQWDFCGQLLDCDPEAMYRFLPRTRCAFLMCSAVPRPVGERFLELNPKAASFRDENDNTLLHAALLEAAFGNVAAALVPGSPERKLYDFLIARGGDPDRKNKRGVSCTDLLSMMSGKVDLWTEKMIKMTESAREKEV